MQGVSCECVQSRPPAVSHRETDLITTSDSLIKSETVFKSFMSIMRYFTLR